VPPLSGLHDSQFSVSHAAPTGATTIADARAPVGGCGDSRPEMQQVWGRRRGRASKPSDLCLKVQSGRSSRCVKARSASSSLASCTRT
jgi:hypothetical protein